MIKGNYLIVGKFDISKYDNSIKTTTNDVILTNEQLSHIVDKHPEVLIYLNKFNMIFNDPDLIFIQNNINDTIWIVKKFTDNLKITIKLNTIKNGINGYINSIIQMQYMNDKELTRNIQIGKVKLIYQKNVEVLNTI